MPLPTEDEHQALVKRVDRLEAGHAALKDIVEKNESRWLAIEVAVKEMKFQTKLTDEKADAVLVLMRVAAPEITNAPSATSAAAADPSVPQGSPV